MEEKALFVEKGSLERECVCVRVWCVCVWGGGGGLGDLKPEQQPFVVHFLSGITYYIL